MPNRDNPLHNMSVANFGAILTEDQPIRCIASGSITANNIVLISATTANTDIPTCAHATSATAAGCQGLLGVAASTVSSGDEVMVNRYKMLTAMDTSGYTTDGDPVFLGVAGVKQATAGTIPTVVGYIVDKSATTGTMILDPNGTLGGMAMAYLRGTNYLSWTTNMDAAAATNEDPILIMLGGDGVAAPNNDIVRTQITQSSVNERVTLSAERNRNGAGFTYIGPDLAIGRKTETTASLNASMGLYGTTAGSVMKSLTMLVNGAGNTATMQTNNMTDGATASATLSFTTGTSTATAAANTASGNLTISTGATTQNGAFLNAASGNIVIGTGVTDSANAGATGANSGSFGISTGNATSSVGAASGSSGSINLTTGNSDDVNSGSIVLTTGTATSGSRGTVQSVARLTTTDAVVSGTARVVGGQILSTVAASAAVANVAAVFAGGSVNIPANTFKVGTRLRFKGMIAVTAVSGGGCTSQITVRLNGAAGTVVFDCNSLNAAAGTAANSVYILDGEIACRTDGAGGTLTGHLKYRLGPVDLAGVTVSQDIAGSAAGTYTVACDTTAANTFDIVGVTDAAGTTLVLHQLSVDLIA